MGGDLFHPLKTDDMILSLLCGVKIIKYPDLQIFKGFSALIVDLDEMK